MEAQKGSARPTPARRAKPAARPEPQRSPEHAHLALDALRTYRADLQAEEDKISYWRRIIQARLDVVRAGSANGGTGTLDAAHLRPVLADSRVSAGRTALVRVVPLDDVPPLPDLGELWERQVAQDDAEGLAALVEDLVDAEARLSEYRTALHRQLEDATVDLIARYRDQPGLCLAALPLPPPRRGPARPAAR